MLKKRWVRALVLVVAVFAISYAAAFYFVSRGPFVVAQDFINQDERVARELGRPSHVGLSWSFSVNLSGNSGEAELRCPVQGAGRDGVVYVDLERRAGVWSVVRANLIVDGRTVPLM